MQFSTERDLDSFSHRKWRQQRMLTVVHEAVLGVQPRVAAFDRRDEQFAASLGNARRKV